MMVERIGTKFVKHGGGRLEFGPEHPDYADFLYWFHFAAYRHATSESDPNLTPMLD